MENNFDRVSDEWHEFRRRQAEQKHLLSLGYQPKPHWPRMIANANALIDMLAVGEQSSWWSTLGSIRNLPIANGPWTITDNGGL